MARYGMVIDTASASAAWTASSPAKQKTTCHRLQRDWITTEVAARS